MSDIEYRTKAFIEGEEFLTDIINNIPENVDESKFVEDIQNELDNLIQYITNKGLELSEKARIFGECDNK